jgi:hypothetical protein
MPTTSIQQRLTALEAEVAALKKQLNGGKDDRPWWQQIAGAFQGDEAFLEAMKLGREYRESLRPKPKAKKRKPKNGRA